jgi:hypothetical protein
MKSQRYDGQTYYDILEVKTTAATQEIHAAYQRAKSTYSTDSPALYSMFTPDEARELLALIEEAFDTLSNQQRRQLYDQKLATRAKNAEGSVHNHKNSNTNDLPDFHVEDFNDVAPASAMKSAMSPSPSAATPLKAVPSVPKGFARTKFGMYEINPNLEDEIQNLPQANGEFLKRIRVYKKISVDQICDETRINKPYYVAVEADDYRSLPAPVFVRGYIIQIARILGLNDKKAAELYMQNMKKALA